MAQSAVSDELALDNRLSRGSDQRSSTNYRADIDGLRALAVLPIVVFHFAPALVPGGYVGVDIFFVISGYLVGGIVLDEIQRGSYSIAGFYGRRFRRLMPALVAMLVATTIGMWTLELPLPLIEYGKSLIAAMLSVSNIFFWKTSGYFEATAETKPLLHTWSLAVEEQFYLLFPLLMILVRRWAGKHLLTAIAGLALLSFAASVYGVRADPVATFYLLPTRLWELLLGVLAKQARWSLLGVRVIREALAFAGVGVVCASILLYSPSMPFPGLAALPPCIGTAMLLFAGANGGTLTGGCLSLPPVVFFGLIS